MLTAGETTLRAFREDDLEVLAALRNDVVLQSKLLALPRASQPERVREWISRMSNDHETLFFVVGSARTGDALGFTQLTHLDFTHRNGELGVALAPEARGKGHGAAAIRLLEQHAHDVFDIRKVLLRALGANVDAIRLYARLGYEPVGTMRAHFYHCGAFHDVLLMEKLLHATRTHGSMESRAR